MTGSPVLPKRTVGLTLLLSVFTLPGAAWADKPCSPDGPRDVGNRRQLFIDNRFIADAFNVELFVHRPVKTGEMTINVDKPWEVGGIGPYSSVLQEGDTYHMWYHAMTSVQWHIDKFAGAICYARSKNGITWEKPNLGVVEFDGGKDNNIVLGQGAGGVRIGQDGGMVFIDPNAPADEKYRMFIAHKESGNGLHIFSSPDGIRWKLTHKSVLTFRPETRGHHLDSQNVLFWDDSIGKYVFYGRLNLGVGNTQARAAGSQGRSIARGEASDLKSFPVVQDMPIVLYPDRFDLWHGQTAVVDYYMSAAVKYPWAADAYFMFPTAYYHYIGGVLPEFPDKVPTNAGPLDTQFAASRDGIIWNRYDRQPFVPLGMKTEFDWANTRTIHGLVSSVDGRNLYMYYRGGDWLHGWDRNEENKALLSGAGLGADRNIAVLSRVVLRMDGFVSARGAYTGGSFLTPKLKFSGSKLVLNIDTSAAGVAKVEILDENGLWIEDFSQDKCDLIHTANDVNRVVSWNGNSDLSRLAGKTVRLRFFLTNCDLYAFQFKD
ncbi:MAG TPA: hypothetical protein VLM89_00835 [Phycisphaerae bacterium]|nr:hypothetical protein [Phycisphaerae bacterium]